MAIECVIDLLKLPEDIREGLRNKDPNAYAALVDGLALGTFPADAFVEAHAATSSCVRIVFSRDDYGAFTRRILSINGEEIPIEDTHNG